MELKDNPVKEEPCLTRTVRAQVMTREDGGWVPVEGGGYSNVGIYKLDGGNTLGTKLAYKIVGTTVLNQKKVLECQLKRHVEYTSATPTFHHWRLDEKKCGLTFLSPADGRAFARAFKRALEELKEGSSSDSSLNPNDEEDSDGYPNEPLLMDTPRDAYVNTPCYVPPGHTSRTNLRDLLVQPPSTTFVPQQHFHKVHYLTHSKYSDVRGHHHLKRQQTDHIWSRTHTEWQSPKRDTRESSNEHSNDSYVELVKCDPSIQHDYMYPAIKPSSDKDENLKKHNRTEVIKTQPPLPPPTKMSYNHERRCIHCGEKFDPDKNKRGECPDAPDGSLDCIGRVTCISCAQGLLYHCFMDVDEDSYPELEDPCVCTASDGHFCKRWVSLGLLSVLVPCLWCYVPLRACHWCGKQCGCCGGRHKPTKSP